MSNFKLKPFLILFGLILTGCASVNYVEPAEGPLSNVRFVTAQKGIFTLSMVHQKTGDGYFDYTTILRLRDPKLSEDSIRNLNIPFNDYAGGAAKELRISAQKKFEGIFYGEETLVLPLICQVEFSYLFQENHEYEVKFDMKGLSCHVTINEIVYEANVPKLVQRQVFE